MNKYDLPEFFPLKIEADHQKISDEFDQILAAAQSGGSVHCGRGNIILDLTYIDEATLEFPEVSFAGSSTERAISHYKRPSSLKNQARRLAIGHQKDPLSDDRNHNRIKSYAKNTYTIEFLQSLGHLTKATFALLEPNSWWPSHFDFSVGHAAKINIPIRTNDEAVSLVWNQRKQKLIRKKLQVGEVWWLNTAHKHTCFNWGETDRLFLLATYSNAQTFIDEVKA